MSAFVTPVWQTQHTARYDMTLKDSLASLVLRDDAALHVIIQKQESLHVEVSELSHARLFLEIPQSTKCRLHIECKEHSHLTLLVFDESDACTIEEDYDIYQGAQLHTAFGEFGKNSTHTVQFNLRGRGSVVEARFAYIASEQQKKTNRILATHYSPDSSCNVENYGVIKQQASLLIDVDSHIIKGALNAQTHQTSRMLTFDSTVRCTVNPMLHIDENEVQASHACSMGTIDENHLYYLQSRGLTMRQAVQLIVSGYVMPLASIFEDEELKDELTSRIVEKAGE